MNYLEEPKVSLSKYIRFYDNVLPKNTLDKFLRICEQQNKFQQGKIIKGKSSNEDPNTINTKVRDTLIWYLTNADFEKSLTDIHWCSFWFYQIKNYIRSYFEDLKIDYSKCPVTIKDIQVLKYVKQGHYVFHIDHGELVPRTLSFIFLVNEDYKGGELVFGLPDLSKTMTIEKKSNRLIIWPSNFLYPHSVTPVTEGIRYSIVAWAL